MHVKDTPIILRVSLIVQNQFQTTPNGFGLWKEYLYCPSYDPDAFISADDLYCPHISTVVPQVNDEAKHLDYPNLYSSKTVELLLDWQNTGSSAKSNREINRLVHGVLHYLEFQLDAL